MADAPEDLLKVMRTLCEGMALRKENVARDRLRRTRLSLGAQPDAKTLFYRAPPGFGKSVQVALAAVEAGAAGYKAAYVCVRKLPDRGALRGDLLAAAILLQIGGEAALRDAAASAAIVPALRRLLAATRQSTVICLDDVDDDPAVEALVEDLIYETPDAVRFALAAADAGGLASLLLAPGVRTFGAAQLAFDEAEANAVVRLDATSAGGGAFAATGGWPALCAFMRETADPALPAATWPETRRYFLTELRARLSEPEWVFLRNAAMLEVVTAESYDYVFKTSSAGRVIPRLQSAHGLLASAREANGRGLTIHPVLRDFLRGRFSEEEASRRSYVLKRVAFWHWRRREFAHAMAAALEAHDYRWAHGLSRDVVLDLALRQGEIDALRRWFAQAPQLAVQRFAALRLGYAWTMYFCQRAEEAERMLQYEIARAADDGAGRDGDQGWVELVLAIGKATHDEMAESERLCREWIAAHGRQNDVGLGAAWTCLAYIAASDRNFDKLCKLSRKADATNRSAGQRYASGWLAAAEIQAALFRGEIARAGTILPRLRGDLAAPGSPSSFASGLLLTLEFQILAESEPDDVQEDIAEAALGFAFDCGVTDILAGVVEAYSRRLYRRGAAVEAQAVLQKCHAVGRARELPRLGALANLMLTELNILEGEASADVETRGLDSPAILPNQAKAIRARAALLQSMSELRKGRHALAERHARVSLQVAVALEDARAAIAARYCLAGAMHAIGADAASRVLIQADQTAQYLNCRATRRWMRDKLPVLHSSLGEFFQRAGDLHEVDQKREVLRPQAAASGGGTSLSVKQMLVLQFLGNGLTNKEIAARLGVTEDTVKWHLRRLFQELGASNRTQAIVEAQSRRLI